MTLKVIEGGRDDNHVVAASGGDGLVEEYAHERYALAALVRIDQSMRGIPIGEQVDWLAVAEAAHALSLSALAMVSGGEKGTAA